LQAVVFGKEVCVAPARRRRDTGIVKKLSQPRLQFFAIRNPVEIGESDFVLRLDPRLDFRRRLIFKPAIWIGDFGAEIVVDLVDFFALRIDELWIFGA
jgi:hypothetical protein